MGLSPTPLRSPAQRHVHLGNERCPYCDQPIPNEKAQQIRARLEAEERERAKELTARLTEQFAQEKGQAVAEARLAGKSEAEATSRKKIAESERQKTAAVTQYQTLKTRHEEVVKQRVQETRDALEKDKTDSVNALKAKHFEDTQKLSALVEDLKRKLERKTSDELGEGAEIDLFESLKEEFAGDRIERIGKGISGADIRHTVVHNSRPFGTILYDSKNRNGWRNDYVDKLARDQRADKADHAILSTLKFPADVRQLHVQDGIIIANPARVIAIVQLLRKHLIQVHTLRLSNTDRAKKTAALYEFITSKRCADQLEAIDTHSEDLLVLQEKEKRAHESTWKQQGALIRSIQKIRADLCNDIDSIIE